MSRWLLLLACVYVAVFTILLPTRLAEPVSKTFGNDAAAYNSGAIHLATENYYSPDGIAPAVEREPGYSFFLSLIYRVFGLENRPAIFIIQGLLHLLGVLYFTRELRKVTSRPAGTVTAGFLLLMPSVFHIVFAVYRESFALSLSLFFAGLFLSMRSRPSYAKTGLMGALFSWMLLTHIPYLFFPLIVLVIGLALPQFPRRMLIPIIALPVIGCLLWGYRNYETGGEFRLIGSLRMAASIQRRALQAKTFDMTDPLRCRWAEYITRDYSKASPDCGMNYDDAVKGREAQKRIIAESKTTILSHLPNYLWQSTFYLVEMHLPYVNGWGKIYNVLEAFATVVLHLGCALSLGVIWKREYTIFIGVILYIAALGAAIEAVPRYHMVILYCYAALAGTGYASAWHWLQDWALRRKSAIR